MDHSSQRLWNEPGSEMILRLAGFMSTAALVILSPPPSTEGSGHGISHLVSGLFDSSAARSAQDAASANKDRTRR
jgi:hypothetical protein